MNNMAGLDAPEINALQESMVSLLDALGLALSEGIGQLITVVNPQVSMQTVDSVMETVGETIQITFSFTEIGNQESVLAFPLDQALAIYGAISGNTPPSEMTEEINDSLSEILKGTIRGLGIALGNALGKIIQLDKSAVSHGPLTLPTAFAMTGEVVQIVFIVQMMDETEFKMYLFLTPEIARGMNLQSSASKDTSQTQQIDSMNVATAPRQDVFQPFDVHSVSEELPRGIDLIMDIPLEATVELGRKEMLIKDVLALSAGSIIELERVAGEPVDLLVNGKLIARGEVVVIEDNFGLRLTEIVSPADRLNTLGKK